MSDNTLANASLNAFSVQPSGDQLVTVPVSLLEDLQDRIDALEDRNLIRQDEKIATLESTQSVHAENQFIQLQLINGLRHKEPGKTELSRAEKIEKYLQARPDHKATFETLKGHLAINKDRLLEAIKTLMDSSPGRYGKSEHQDISESEPSLCFQNRRIEPNPIIAFSRSAAKIK